MTDERLGTLYRLAQERRAAVPGGCTVALELMIDVVEGRLSDAEHRQALATIMADPKCRREFELLRVAAAGAAPARSSRLKSGLPLRVAATIVLALGIGSLWYVQRQPGSDPTRAPGAPAIELVAPPEGDHPGSDIEFVWRSVTGAFRYELILTTAGGRSLFSATLADTTLVLPDSIRPPIGEELRWWVEATTADGVQHGAPLRRLRVITP